MGIDEVTADKRTNVNDGINRFDGHSRVLSNLPANRGFTITAVSD